MVVKTRSYTHVYDNRILFRSNDGSESVIGGSAESLLSSVTADYPAWDYRRMIQEGENCTTELSGTQNGFRDRPLSSNVKEVLKPLSLTPSSMGHVDIESLFWQLSAGQVTNLTRQRLRGNVWRSNLGTTSSNASLLASVTNQALMGFNRKALKRQTEWNSFVTAGELGEALRGMVHPLRSLRKATGNMLDSLMKKGRRRGPWPIKEAKKVASDTWLEFSFGIKPTVSDIEDAARACARISITQPPRNFVSHTAYGVNTVPVNDNVTTGSGYLRVRRRKQIRNEYVGVKFYGTIGNDALDEGARAFLNTFGISWGEVVPTVWELIPYSFLVDYFTNAGEVISALSHGTGGLKWVSKGTCFVSESYWSDVEVEYLNPSTVQRQDIRSLLGERCFKVSRTISRGTYTGTRIPSFEWNIPGMGLKWLNMAALGLSYDRAVLAVTNDGRFVRRHRAYRR